ncbi:hypothetical protein HOLleu_27728 [Holothuria leucospilota]|uniref:Uncharacterized protein n=1 Tax=Holothuria leucospilota TaxID=206669 RepID=A0A9Q1H3P2_HOLLE|nr:hypothetical protein HOLleu_27728 [Holothuria leucospilota]
MERKLDIIMEQLSKLPSLPSQLEAMKQEVKSLRGAVSDIAKSAEVIENEILLMNIHGKSISYSAWRKKELIKKEQELFDGIESLEVNLTDESVDIMQEKKTLLESI